MFIERYFKMYKFHVVLIHIELLEFQLHLIFTLHDIKVHAMHYQFLSVMLLHFYSIDKLSVCYMEF